MAARLKGPSETKEKWKENQKDESVKKKKDLN